MSCVVRMAQRTEIQEATWKTSVLGHRLVYRVRMNDAMSTAKQIPQRIRIARRATGKRVRSDSLRLQVRRSLRPLHKSA